METTTKPDELNLISDEIVKVLTQFGKRKRGVVMVTVAHRMMIPLSSVQQAMPYAISERGVVDHADSGDISLAK